MSIVSSFALSRCFAYSPGLFFCHEQSRLGSRGHVRGKFLTGKPKEKNRQSRTTCSYFCSRGIKNRNDLACNPDKTEEDHLCFCFQSITLPGID